MAQTTYTNGDTSTTYTVPSGVQELRFVAEGAGGGSGGGGDDATSGSGGNGGYIVVNRIDVTPGETLDVYVGQGGFGGNGPDGTFASGNGGSGGGPSWNPGGDGGDGGDDQGAGGGGGGGPTAVVRQSDGTVLVAAGGGGGGGGEGGEFANDGGGGGGGGARGGLGGSGEDTDSFPGQDGQDGSGSGFGGDGGDGDATSGTAGGQGADSSGVIVNQSTGGGGSGAPSPGTYTDGSQGASGRILIVEAPAAPSLSVSNTTNTAVDLDIGDTTDEQGVRIYRRPTGGSYTQIADLNADVVPTTYTDSNLTEGVQYEYYVEAYNFAGVSPSGSVTTTTALPAPTLDSTSAGSRQVTANWTDNATDEDGYRVLGSTDGGSTFSNISGDLAADTTSETVTGLRDGEEYTLKVEAFTSDATAESGTQAVQTDLPDVTIDVVANDIEDELTVEWTDVLNYGDYRVQARKTGVSASWGSAVDTTVGEASTSYTISGLSDGERYDVRLRTETEHEDGVYDTDGSTTLLPAPTGLSFPSKTATSLTLSWTDNADNEDGYRVYAEREYDSGYGPRSLVADLGAGTTSYSASSLVPDTTYRYTVEVFTEDSQNEERTTVTTDTGEYVRSTGRTNGWSVSIVAPSGKIRRPALTEEPTYYPKLNGLPRVEIPVKRDDRWSNPEWEDAELRVWEDGKRRPIEQVSGVSHTPGETIIRGKGGTELLELQKHEFTDTDAHVAAGTVIDNTSYTKIVDAPDAGETLAVESDGPGSQEGYLQVSNAQTPLYVDSTGPAPSETGVTMAQTCFLVEAEEVEPTFSTDQSEVLVGDNNIPNWSNGAAVDAAYREISYTFTTNYEIPASEVGVYTLEFADEFSGYYETYLDGVRIERRDATGTTISNSGDTPNWSNRDFDTLTGTGSMPTLSPGSHTVRVLSFSASGHRWVDALAVFDKRYHNAGSFPDPPSGEIYGHLSGPPLYPTGGLDATLVIPGFQSATGARVESAFTDTSGAQALALSNDGGSTYQSASNTETLDVTFASPGPDINFKVTLDAYGSRTGATPKNDYLAQRLQAFDLYTDIRDSPPLSNEVYEDNGKAILTDLANRGYGLWEVTWDDANGIQIEFTNAGQRTSNADFDVVDYDWDKTTLGRQVERVSVYGGRQTVGNEEFVADLGNAASLSNGDLITGSERVYDDSGTSFERGSDYSMGYQIGFVRGDVSGNLTDGDTYNIDYEWKPQAEWNKPGSDPKKELAVTIPGAITDEICQSIAYYLIQVLSDPVESGSATIEDLPPGWGLLDAFAANPIPATANNYHVSGVTHEAGKTTIQLQSRQSTEEIVSDVRRRLTRTNKRV